MNNWNKIYKIIKFQIENMAFLLKQIHVNYSIEVFKHSMDTTPNRHRFCWTHIILGFVSKWLSETRNWFEVPLRFVSWVIKQKWNTGLKLISIWNHETKIKEWQIYPRPFDWIDYRNGILFRGQLELPTRSKCLCQVNSNVSIQFIKMWCHLKEAYTHTAVECITFGWRRSMFHVQRNFDNHLRVIEPHTKTNVSDIDYANHWSLYSKELWILVHL